MDSQKTWVIVGLGNPGKEYAKTRHNLGWMVVETLADQFGWAFKEDKNFKAYLSKGTFEGRNVHLLLPTTYMNLSGHTLEKYLSYYKLSASDVIVVTDDIALDLGDMRVRTFGSSGGHNGLKSIESVLGHRHYIRLRMGIGLHKEGRRLSDHVLDRFSEEETALLPHVLERGSDIVKRLMLEKIEQVMAEVNERKQKKHRPSEPSSGDDLGEYNEQQQSKSV